jgi:hypothetical protein
LNIINFLLDVVKGFLRDLAGRLRNIDCHRFLITFSFNKVTHFFIKVKVTAQKNVFFALSDVVLKKVALQILLSDLNHYLFFKF